MRYLSVYHSLEWYTFDTVVIESRPINLYSMRYKKLKAKEKQMFKKKKQFSIETFGIM